MIYSMHTYIHFLFCTLENGGKMRPITGGLYDKPEP